MDVKPGYKKHEAGYFPEEWDATRFSELVTEYRGGAPLKATDFTTTGIKVLPKGGVGRTGWLSIDDDDVQYCSLSYATAHRNNQVDECYTIVVLRDLVPSGPSIGLMVRIREADTFVLAQGVYGFKVNERADPGYLVQLSNTYWYRQLMNSVMVGSTQVHITNTAFKSIRLPLPALLEQRAIATALSDVDALLGALDRLITKKRDLKQAAMQQLLTGQARLPGFQGKWEAKRLEQSCEVITKGTTPTSIGRNFTAAGVNFLKAESISESGEPLPDKVAFIDTATHKLLKRSQLKEGDLLIHRGKPPALPEDSQRFDLCGGRVSP